MGNHAVFVPPVVTCQRKEASAFINLLLERFPGQVPVSAR